MNHLNILGMDRRLVFEELMLFVVQKVLYLLYP